MLWDVRRPAKRESVRPTGPEVTLSKHTSSIPAPKALPPPRSRPKLGGEFVIEQNRQPSFAVEEFDAKRKRLGNCRRTAGGDERRACCARAERFEAEVELGRSGTAQCLMRTERCVVKQRDMGTLVQVAGAEWGSETNVEHVLQRSPEAFDDGDRAVLADRAEAMEHVEALKRIAKRCAFELRSLIGDEVARAP